MVLVLASGSPRRRDLLASLGLEFEIHIPEIDERPFEREDPESYVARLAVQKAQALAAPGRVVIAADTTVVFGDTITGKPSSCRDARRMLSRLEGKTHAVLTGVAVVREGLNKVQVQIELERSEVRLVPMTAGEISAYVDTGEPLDKAGAYALQGIGAMFVAEVHGSPSNIVGLPLHLAVRLLRSAGVKVLGEAG